MFLRPQHDTSEDSDVVQYTAMGHGFVHGLMNGEAADLGLSVEQVTIVWKAVLT